ncbi:MAG: response regulator transcription factor [Oscillospiraceae bacterium]|nr:response regulator transcription factor [Oscillospiraceae bacterium]
MYQAAIVEDEQDILRYMQARLAKEFESRSLPVAFDSFSGGERFLAMLREHYHYDMVFLDIEMPGIDGITVCRRIREIAPEALVVFVSNKEELVFQTFEVQPFRFIRKSQFDALAPSLADSLLGELALRHPRQLTIVEARSGDVYSFDIHTIRYIEAQGKDCRIVTGSTDTLVRCRLMDLEAQLDGQRFLRPHRSYLVNCQFVFHIGKNEVVLTDRTTIPMSRGKQEEIKQQFLQMST